MNNNIQELSQNEKWPYPFSDYLLRIPWTIAKYSIWKLAWHRFSFLRMLILKLFRADTHLSSLAHGSTDILRPWDIKFGKYSSLGPRVKIYNLRRIEIGENTVISQDVYLCGGTHDYKQSSFPLLRKNIIIGDKVWICAGAFIGPGVTIGEGAIIGARAVVTKDVEPWTIVGGNPAKFIKKRAINE